MLLWLLLVAASTASAVMCVQPGNNAGIIPSVTERAPDEDGYLGFVDGPNLYAYVKQNPWTAFDPEGLAENPIVENRRALIKAMEDADMPEVAAAQTRMLGNGQAMASATANAANTAISLTPIGAANEAISGRNAKGEQLGMLDRLLSAIGVIPAGKIGKLARVAGDAKAAKAATLARNVENGAAAEQLATKKLVEEGEKVLGTRASVNTSEGRRVLDNLVEGEAGKLKNVEVKFNEATRNASQIAKDEAMAQNGGTLVGKNVPPDLRGKTVKIETEVRQVSAEELAKQNK